MRTATEADVAMQLQAGRVAYLRGDPLPENAPVAYHFAYERAREQDATRAQLASARLCNTCGGTPHPSGLVCICGGTGRAIDEAIGLRRAVLKAESDRDAAQRDRDAYKRVLEACDEAAQRIRLRVDSRPADTVSEAELHELLDEQARGIQARIRAALSSSSEPRKGGET